MRIWTTITVQNRDHRPACTERIVASKSRKSSLRHPLVGFFWWVSRRATFQFTSFAYLWCVPTESFRWANDKFQLATFLKRDSEIHQVGRCKHVRFRGLFANRTKLCSFVFSHEFQSPILNYLSPKWTDSSDISGPWLSRPDRLGMDGLCEVLVVFFENDQRRREIGEENHHVLYNYVYIYMYIYIYIIYIYIYVRIPSPESPVDMVYEWDSDI